MGNFGLREFPGRRARHSRSGSRFRPSVEPLEHRLVLSTILVATTNDAGSGSLRAAIAQANSDSSPDTIQFAPAVTGAITLLSALPALATDMTIDGPGASALAVSRSAGANVPEFRILSVLAGSNVAISGLTISGGKLKGSFGGALETNFGGGINNAGTLAVTNCTITGNFMEFRPFSGGGGLFNSGTATITGSTISNNSAEGGGVCNTGTMTINRSTISNNTATLTGGGITNGGSLTLLASTISGNTTNGSAGGISNGDTGTMTATNCTISGNSSVVGGGAIEAPFAGSQISLTNCTISGNADKSFVAAIVSNGTLRITASILDNPSGNLVNLDRLNRPISGGHNLFSDDPHVPLDRSSDRINIDPLLAPLGHYGGPTETVALLPGSPAIDTGVTLAGVTTDERGVARPQGAAPDIGAFESRGFRLAITSGNGQTTRPGTRFHDPLVIRVTSPFGEPVVGGRVTFDAPASGASAALAGNSAPIGASGQASVVATANRIVGTYTINAGVGISPRAAFTLENQKQNQGTPPSIVGVQRFGVHEQPTTLVLTFDRALNRTRAQDVSNYQIVTLGGHGRGGKAVGQRIPVVSAQYDPRMHTVIVHPAVRLDLRNAYQLRVIGTAPSGLTSATGVLLDGAGTGRPGSDFVTTIDRSTLTGISYAHFQRIQDEWAARGGVIQG